MSERAPDRADPLQPKPVPPRRGLAAEYAALEATLQGTPVGRWFLAEYARRNRTPETQLMLDAIARLEAAVLKPQRRAGFSSVLGELVEISEAIARTRREIAQLKPPPQFDRHITDATEELDQIVEATETATTEILSAAEDVQEVAWTLREKGVAPELCDRLDQHAIDIYTACSFQDITGQRTAKVVRALHHVEDRINTMIGAWRSGGAVRTTPPRERGGEEDRHLLSGPPKDGEGLDQRDVDAMLKQPHAPDTQGASDRPAAAEAAAAEPFERPEPLSLSELHAVKRAALFG